MKGHSVTIFSVGSSRALTDALRIARSGDVIKVASGTYDAIKLANVQLSGVTITSADATRPAVFNNLQVTNSRGITFSHVEFSTGGSTAVKLSSSSDIVFDHVEVHGPRGVGAAATAVGIALDGNRNITISNSEFADLANGVTLGGNNAVRIAGNYFHDIRTDGIHGSTNTDVTIADNFFTDFTPAAGDHADAIQFFTTGASTATRDLTITGNLVLRGDGAPVQGIFIRDGQGNLPFDHVVIRNNVIGGGNFNGISLDNAVRSEIIDNTVIGSTDRRSWIRTVDAADTVLRGNVSTFIMAPGAQDGVLAGNSKVAQSDNANALITNWIGAHGAALTTLAAHEVQTLAQQLHLSVVKGAVAAAQVAALPFDTINGTSGADTLSAISGHDARIDAGAGNDTLNGAATGRHELIGGLGDDYYNVRGVGDVVVERAGGGTDTVSTAIDYTLPDFVENLRLGSGGLTGIGNDLDNRIIGSADGDRIFGMGGDDTIQGLNGNDWISGGAGDDDLRGDAGNDTIYGDAGRDIITGGAGNDRIFGGDGNDRITGGDGADVMTGGEGKDTFRFDQADIDGHDVDIITDFTRGEDSLYFRAADANANTDKLDRFTFIGNEAFHGVAGELNFSVVNGNALVCGDTNGDGIADFTIILQGVTNLTASDFAL